jgi:hypothetical protein
MRLLRDLKWKLADRYPALDKPGLYRRPVQTEHQLDPWSRLLIGFGAVIICLIGLFGLLVAGILIVAAF